MDVVAQHELREAAALWREILVVLIWRLLVFLPLRKVLREVGNKTEKQTNRVPQTGRPQMTEYRLADRDLRSRHQGSHKLDRIREARKCVFDEVVLARNINHFEFIVL